MSIILIILSNTIHLLILVVFNAFIHVATQIFIPNIDDQIKAYSLILYNIWHLWPVYIFLAQIIYRLSPLGSYKIKSEMNMVPLTGDQLHCISNLCYHINPKVKLYFYKTSNFERNALAFGWNKICFSEDLLNIPEDQLIGVLAHEMAHIKYKDSLIFGLLVANINISRLCFRGIFIIIGLFFSVFSIVCDIFLGVISGLIMGLARIIVLNSIFSRGYVTKLLWWCVSKLCQLADTILYEGLTLLNQLLSRQNEYRCDEFAAMKGYGEGLKTYLKDLEMYEEKKYTPLLDMIFSSHPSSQKRVYNLDMIASKLSDIKIVTTIN